MSLGWIDRFWRVLLRPIPRPQPPPPPPPRAVVAPPGLDALWHANQGLLAAHNAVRAYRGLAPLSWDHRLSAAALVQALDCARRDELSHEGTDGSWPRHRIEHAGYRAVGSSENAHVASWAATAEDATDAWLKSAVGHREAVLGPYDDVGGAYCDTPDGRRYWIACYGATDR